MQTAQVDGQTVKVGDWVSFKSDIEQSGQICKISDTLFGGKELWLENYAGFRGDYIGGRTLTRELARDCWID